MAVIRFAGTSPAAGAVADIVAPADMRVTAVKFQLVTDGNAATRRPAIYIQTGGATDYQSGTATTTQAAGLTQTYSFVEGSNEASAFGITEKMSATIVKRGTTIRINISNIQAGDQISAIVITGIAA